MRILIVEDDPRIHTSLAEDLRRQHYAVDVVNDGLTGLDFARTGVHDVILLDVLLPGLDGLQLCRRLRDENLKAPILMITARGEVSDKVAALDAGADDYVVKPFDLTELSARIRAAWRRQNGEHQPTLARGPLRLDPNRLVVTYLDAAVPLTGTEYAILETLMRNPLQVFSRAMLQDKVASFDGDAPRDSIKTHITNLRRKLRDAGGVADPIENVYGIGYRLADDP
ncbi:MAG: response regulator transcription factor [Candidatus Cybelea sp.]